LYVFEAPIDMLSFITLHKKDWQTHSYLTLCGVAGQAVFQTLNSNPQLRQISLCLDNDEPGLAASGRISEKLKQAGYSDVSRLLSQAKDWNADLQTEREIEKHARDPCAAMQLA
jgi:hypothetical protein